jgi:hypothetical protein
MLRAFRATAANATTTPTFAPDSLTARTITRLGGSAVQLGDIPGNLAECWVRYNLANTRWELLNLPPGNVAVGNTAARPSSPGNVIRFNSQTIAFEGYDGAVWRNLNAPNGGGPSTQAFAGTSGTYTTPANALYLVIEMVGSGGGGGGSGAAATAGGNGGTTTFNSINASGGGGGAAATTTAGNTGGTGGASGTGSAVVRFPGAAGNPGGNVSSSIPVTGGSGASSIFGGAGQAGTSSINAGTAQANTGSGGGGAGSASASFGGGGGGGAGEYARLVIASPAATYSYSAATGGSAGGGTTVGGAGSNGVIIVTAHFS